MAMVGAQDPFTRATRYGVLTAFSVFCLFPFMWMVDTAFKPMDEVLSSAPSFIIRHPTLFNFKTVLLHSPFLIYLRNSCIVSGFSTLLTMTSATTPGIMLFRGARETDWGPLMAASILTILPVGISFLYLQRFLSGGLAAGAVKG